MNMKEYAQNSPHLFVHQPQASRYYQKVPQTFAELVETSDSEDLNAFTSIAFSAAPPARCCVCQQQPFDESLYRCPTCNAPFCRAQCGEKHMLRCVRVK